MKNVYYYKFFENTKRQKNSHGQTIQLQLTRNLPNYVRKQIKGKKNKRRIEVTINELITQK